MLGVGRSHCNIPHGYVEDHGCVDYDHLDHSTRLVERILWNSTQNVLDFVPLVECVVARDGEMGLQRYVLSSLYSQSRWENVSPIVPDTTIGLHGCDLRAKDLRAKRG